MTTARLMTKTNVVLFLSWSLALAALILDLSSDRSVGEHEPYPNQPIQIVVPFAPGGESDTFARTIKQAIEANHLLPQSVVIVNRGGAGGTVGSRSVVDADPDGYTVLLLHDAILTAKYYPNSGVDYGPEAFEPVAATGSNEMLLVASTRYPHSDLKALMKEAAEKPDTISFGVNFGAPTHFVALMLERVALGARFRFVQAGGGSKRLHQLLGGHLQLTAFSVSEYLRFRSPEIRALAIFADERNKAALPDVPTAKELGYPVEGNNVQMWWMPKGTPADHVKKFADVLSKAMQTTEVQKALSDVHVKPIVLTGKQLRERIRRREKEIAQVQLRGAGELPRLSVWVLGAVCVVGLITLWKHGIRKSAAGTTSPSRFRGWSLLLVLALLGCYVLALSCFSVGFRASTLMLVIGPGMVLGARSRSQVLTLIPLSITLSFGIHWLFTVPLGAALP